MGGDSGVVGHGSQPAIDAPRTARTARVVGVVGGSVEQQEEAGRRGGPGFLPQNTAQSSMRWSRSLPRARGQQQASIAIAM